MSSLYSKYDLATGNSNRRRPIASSGNLLYGRDHRSGTRSWHPSPYVSDVSDEELDHELTVEDKAAKVRAEIKRRRQRLADSGKQFRNYSFDDYNNLGDYFLDCDPLLSDVLNEPNSAVTAVPTRSNSYGKSKYSTNDYPLSGSKERYFSDE